MKTELIIFHRPNSGGLSAVNNASLTASNIYYGQKFNPNQPVVSADSARAANPVDPIEWRPSGISGQGTRVDLYDNVDIPITYTILDIREPDKRKTSWSKTIKIPGTKNNNRIFKHIYHISEDGWTKIGNTVYYQGFNAGLRTEIIVLNDGIQVLKGNLQLKNISKDRDGNIEYDILLTGDLTSIFGDVGNAKLADLDFSEWDHEWSKTNIVNSWGGIVQRNGLTYSSMKYADPVAITRLERQSATNSRMMITTNTAHGLDEGDFVQVGLYYNTTSYNYYATCNGTWQVAEVHSTTRFSLNTPLPLSVLSSPNYPTVQLAISSNYIRKVQSYGRGYVYPLVSWGDEYDFNSFPVTSMAPSYFVKEIWDKIFESANSKYESTFLTSEFFNRLILTQKKQTYDLSAAEVKSRQFLVGNRDSYDIQVSYNNLSTRYFNFGTTASYTLPALLTGGNTPVHSPQDGEAKMKFAVETGMISATNSFFDGGVSSTNQVGNWDPSRSVWKVSKSGEYDVQLNMNLESWVDVWGSEDDSSPTGTASISFGQTSHSFSVGNIQTLTGMLGYGPKLRVYVDIFRKRGGVEKSIYQTSVDFDAYPVSANYTWSSTNPNWSQTAARFQPTSWINKPISIDMKGAYFSKNDEVYIVVSYYLQGKQGHAGTTRMFRDRYYMGDGDWWDVEFDGKWMVKVKGINGNMPNTFGNIPSPKSGENSIIYGREFLPKDMTCQDFMKNIIKMFNLHIEPDREIERLYYIEPRDDYYYDGSNGATDYVDWTEKLDGDSVEITPMAELTSKYYTFQNKAETDYWNKRFKDERGRDYMKFTKEIDNDFLKNETKIDVSFGSTVMINNPEGSDVVMPAVLQKEANGTFKSLSNTAPRILIWVGMKPYSGGNGLGLWNLGNPVLGQGFYGWELISSSNIVAVGASATPFHLYPYAGTVDSPLDPMYDINWFNMEDGDFVYWNYARWSDHNLYNAYWKNFIEEISDPTSKVVKAKFNLTPKDIYNLDFRKIYVVDGVYYRLQKVMDYNALGGSLTSVELLKLKQPTRYRRRTVDYADTFITYTNNIRPLLTTTYIKAPKRKDVRDGSFTNVMPSNLGMGTIQVNGLGNVVGDIRGGHIVGNENQIGAGSSNITIKGNGVSVAGGLSNVNVIGTDKIIVSESDVTYINGIRYKYGVPVSKSNIIDGGVTTATSSLNIRRALTITTNVVDSGEDLVINEGSSTHEDVVNAGADSILPDVAELGVTTTTTPAPRTNFSGGYIIEGTASMYQVILAKKFDESAG